MIMERKKEKKKVHDAALYSVFSLVALSLNFCFYFFFLWPLSFLPPLPSRIFIQFFFFHEKKLAGERIQHVGRAGVPLRQILI